MKSSADCKINADNPKIDKPPWIKVAVQMPNKLINAEDLGLLTIVFNINTPLGPGEITNNKATKLKANISFISIDFPIHGLLKTAYTI